MNGGDAAAAGPAPRRTVLTCALLAFAGTFVWFWSTLHHGLRSDDYLVVYYTDRLTGAVHWGRVLEEFVRPWFGAGELYRPMISVSFGVEMALFPTPSGRHAFNVFFVAIAAASAAATAALLAPRRAAVAACVAGACVILHPAAVETAAWISARVTSLQMAFGALACLAYARHLVLGRASWPVLLWQALALLSKEGAVTLPLLLFVIHCVHAPRAPWLARGRALVPFAIVIALYFVLRVAVLGRIGPIQDEGAIADRAMNVVVRIAQLFAPPSVGASHPSWAAALLAAALVPLWRTAGARSLAIVLALCAVLAPTWHIPASYEVLWGRFLFDAVFGLAVVLGVAVTASRTRAATIAAVIAAVAWLVVMASTSTSWLARFGAEDTKARATEKALVAAAGSATPAQPFACAGLPYLPLFHYRLWGVLGLEPFAPRDLSVIGLPELLVAAPDAPEYFKDAAPVHAVLAAGGTVATLRDDTMQLVSLPRGPAGTTELTATAAAPHEFVVARPWPGTAVAAVEVLLPQAARELRWGLLADVPPPHVFGTQTRANPGTVTWLPSVHALAPVLLEGLGVPFHGLRIEVDGQAPPAGTRVIVHAALPRRPLPQRASGAERAREDLYSLSLQPPWRERARLYVLLPTGVRHMDVPADGAPMVPLLHEHLRYALDLFPPQTVHWYWQSQPDADGEPWCSELDWATCR